MKRLARAFVPFALALAASSPALADDGLAVASGADADAGSAVQCVLPGMVRRVGPLTLLMPRRAVTLSARECAVRGGEPAASGRD